MIDMVEIQTPDGVMPTRVARPETGRSRANILIYMDAMGIRDELIVKFAQRYAQAGFTAVLPDLYYRFGKDVTFDATKSYKEMPAEQQPFFFSLVEKMREDGPVTRDTGLLLDAIPTQEGGATAWGAIGYCMGGRFVVRAMAAYPDRIKAGASVYGTALVTDQPGSPHRDVPRIRGEVYLAFGANDDLTPPPVIDTLREQFDQSGIKHETQVFDGCGHAFMMPGKTSTYRHEAAEAVWAKSLALFSRL